MWIVERMGNYIYIIFSVNAENKLKMAFRPLAPFLP